ncbi:hypothetical protein McanMca71_005196 [Microsporum canis]|uniref:ferric-chelate reductase (NADPH) n=1 Tax=Arthroderma otae (strain ATCC MYA-4605 / CBS 113480) TaxID=554155 RepID=C5FDG1_ARTOC|nr:FreB [Microsporum canis CBS 113480]EEQ27935.1 FreB [Microsporum canis CBS 113480]
MRASFLLAPLLAGVAAASFDQESSHHEQGPLILQPQEVYDDKVARYYILSGGSVFAVILIWSAILRMSAHMRRLTSLPSDTQRYFVTADSFWSWMKRNVMYAPLLWKRHNREYRLSAALNMGTLPTRFHTVLLLMVIGSNAYLCLHNLPFSKPEKEFLPSIRKRTGTMATVNLIPLVLMAGRNNPLIKLLDVSFDTWNLLHRWLGRIVVLESLAHTICWMVGKVHTDGWEATWQSFTSSNLILTGIVATSCVVVISIHSVSVLRHAFYETFLHFHIALVVVFLVFMWLHLLGYPQLKYLLGAILLWAVERAWRIITIVYRNFLRGNTTATVEALPGDAMRVTLRIARPWTFRPGQHLYLYIPSVGWWTSHPFSVAWSDTEESDSDEKGLVMTKQDVLGLRRPTMSLVIRRRTGMTNKLYERATKNGATSVTLSAMVEGPYGAEHALDSYGSVVLFAAGVGITHHVPYVRHLVAGFADGTAATRRLTLVWVIQSPEHLEWIRPWMTSILTMNRRREVLRIMLFITRPRNTKEIHSPSTTVQMFPGKPNIGTILDGEIEKQVGAMGVMVCGTGSLSDEIRYACRKRQIPTHVDFIEECFTW